MNGSHQLRALLTAAVLGTGNVWSASDPNAGDDYIVVLKQSARSDDVVREHGLQPRRRYKHAVNGFAGRIPEGRLRSVKNDPRVVLVEPDAVVTALGQTVPNGVRRIGATECPLARIDGNDERVNVDIAIIDTGIDLTHPDLNVYQHVSFTADSTDGNDGHGHGTHVAGTVAALDNGIGVVGVAPGARLWAVKVLDDSGAGSTSTIITGVEYVTQHADEIEVANMSLGGRGTSEALRLAIQNSIAKGVVYVAAAGNSGTDIFGGDGVFGTADDFFPGNYPEVLSVTAVVDTDGKSGGVGATSAYGADDTQASFSNFGISVLPGSQVNSPGGPIDLAAPGASIYSTFKGGGYATMSGTSMACPHVAGAVALYIAQFGRAYTSAGVYAIRQALVNAAEPQASWGINPTNPHAAQDFYPEGLVNVASFGAPVSNPNSPPSITLSSPGNGTSAVAGYPLALKARATDGQEGDLSSAIVWTSSLSGLIGSGGDLAATLVAGTHNLSATVTDSAGASATAWTKVNVISANSSPTVSIAAPLNGGSYVSGNAVQFVGSASDVEDGAISAKIVWSSSLTGPIGTGATLASALSSGLQTITATVTDSGGATSRSSVTVTVTVPNSAPVVTISSPLAGSTALSGSPIQFAGSATDTQDGNLSAKIVWSSNLSGQLGTGSSVTTTLTAGAHVITASVRDSAGATASSSVTLTVTKPIANAPPTVSILSPATGSVLAQSLSVALSGKASDLEDGDLTARITWSSSLDGALGVGGSLAAKLSPGSHTITASVADSAGATTRSSVSLLVPTPNLLVTVASDASTYAHRDTVNLTVNVADASGSLTGAAVNLTLTTASARTVNLQAITDSTGRAILQYLINSKRDGVGIYSVKAGASLAGWTAGSATSSFRVTK